MMKMNIEQLCGCLHVSNADGMYIPRCIVEAVGAKTKKLYNYFGTQECLKVMYNGEVRYCSVAGYKELKKSHLVVVSKVWVHTTPQCWKGRKKRIALRYARHGAEGSLFRAYGLVDPVYAYLK